MQKRKLEIVIHRSHIFSSSKVHIDKQRSESKSYFLKKQETFVHWVEIPNFPNCFVINLLLVQEEAMFRDLVLHIQDIIGSRTCWDLKITSQSFILQKKTQDYLKSSLKNSHFCQDLMHIDRPQSGRPKLTYSSDFLSLIAYLLKASLIPLYCRYSYYFN